MKVTHLIGMSVFFITSIFSGAVLASCGGDGGCGGGGDSACSSNGPSSDCTCTDPECSNGDTCEGSGRCCELFGNIGAAPASIGEITQDNDDAVEEANLGDFPPYDSQYVTNTYNTDSRVNYKP